MITIAGFTKLSKQAMFDISFKHVIAQGEACTNSFGDCVYKDDAGHTCAAGIFIKPSERAKIHGSWCGLLHTGKIPTHNADFIQSLQEAHDNASLAVDFIKTYTECMKMLAASHELKMTASSS